MKGVINASPEVLRALAQEGIQLSEEELLLTVRGQPHGLDSANGSLASPPRVFRYVALLCRLGIHKGPWGYVAEWHCAQMRECGRCGAVKLRTKHQREWRYVFDRACEQTRTCKRCKAVSGHRTRHSWLGSWVVPSPIVVPVGEAGAPVPAVRSGRDVERQRGLARAS